MWKSLRLGQKIWLSFSVLIAGYSLSILLGFRLGQETEVRLRHVSESFFTAATQSQAAFTAFNEQIEQYNNAVLLEDETFLETAQKKANAVHYALRTIVSLPDIRAQDTEDIRKAAGEFKQFTDAAHRVYGAMSAMSDDFEEDAAEEESGESFEEQAFELAQQTEQLREMLEGFTQRFSEALKRELAQISDNTRYRRYLELVSFLVVVAISLLTTAIFIRRAIILPLRQLTDIASKIAVGDLSGQLSLTGRDEFGQVASAFHDMMTYIREIAHTAQRLSSGEISVRVSPRSEHDVLNRAFAETIRYIQETADVAEKISQKDLQIDVAPRSEHDVLNLSFQRMVVNLREMMGELQRSLGSIQKQNWSRKGQNELNTRLRGEHDPRVLGERIVSYLASYVNAQIGALFLLGDTGERFRLAATYAYDAPSRERQEIAFGEGLSGQAALENRYILTEKIPEDYFTINTGLIELPPTCLLIVPFAYEGRVTGFLELGAAHRFSDAEIALLQQVAESIGIAFHSTQARLKMQELLEETQRQSEELQRQHRLLEERL